MTEGIGRHTRSEVKSYLTVKGKVCGCYDEESLCIAWVAVDCVG